MATFSRAVHSLPLLFAVSTCVTVIISYVLAVTSGQVYPVLPSISMTAAFEPQGSLFAQCLTVVSIIALLMISVRYLQLELLSRRLKERGQPCPWIKFNAIALLFGIACALALTMVASFRRPGTSEACAYMGTLHYISSSVLFLSGCIYCWFQSFLTYHLIGLNTTTAMFALRMTVSCVFSLTGATFPFWNYYAFTLYEGSDDALKVAAWHPGQPGYEFHVFGTAGEWAAVFCLAIYGLSFHQEFQELSVDTHCFFDPESETSLDKYHRLISAEEDKQTSD